MINENHSFASSKALLKILKLFI